LNSGPPVGVAVAVVTGVLNNLGGVALERRDLPQVQAFFRESLMQRQAVGDKAGVAECLEGLAAVAVQQTQPYRSGQLYGTAAALRENVGAPLPPASEAMNQQYASEAQAQLGTAAWAEAFAAGRALSLGQAVADALEAIDHY